MKTITLLDKYGMPTLVVDRKKEKHYYYCVKCDRKLSLNRTEGNSKPLKCLFCGANLFKKFNNHYNNGGRKI